MHHIIVSYWNVQLVADPFLTVLFREHSSGALSSFFFGNTLSSTFSNTINTSTTTVVSYSEIFFYVSLNDPLNCFFRIFLLFDKNPDNVDQGGLRYWDNELHR